jgi:hypothetical protein
MVDPLTVTLEMANQVANDLRLVIAVDAVMLAALGQEDFPARVLLSEA